MHARWSAGTVAMAVVWGLSACTIRGPEGDEQPLVEDGDARTPPDDARPLPIIDGAEATGYPSAAIINMKKGSWHVSSCSGAVIAPRIVLTAGHCAIGNYDNWDVFVPYAAGQSANSTEALVYDYTGNPGGYVDPNKHDVALLVLSSDITLSTYPVVASSAYPVGTKVRNIGRIDNGVMNHDRLFVSQPLGIKNGSAYGYPYDYVATEVIQPGDSGGPVVLDGVTPHEIVAVNSGSGGGIEVLARVDLLESWITAQIQAHGGTAPPPPPPPAESCAHELCEEGVALTSSCDPCAAQICAQDAYCCTTAWDGVCVGEVASICGQSCTAPPPPPEPEPEDPCGGVTFEGQCDGLVLSWCENEQVTTIDCAQSGKSCGWDGGNGFYNCL